MTIGDDNTSGGFVVVVVVIGFLFVLFVFVLFLRQTFQIHRQRCNFLRNYVSTH